MSISSSDRFGGIIVSGTEILALCFPVNAFINGSEPDSLLEAANTKSLPYDTMLQAGTAYATGEMDFNKRGPGVSSYKEGLANLKKEGMRRFDGVRDKLSDEAMKRCDDAKRKVSVVTNPPLPIALLYPPTTTPRTVLPQLAGYALLLVKSPKSIAFPNVLIST